MTNELIIVSLLLPQVNQKVWPRITAATATGKCSLTSSIILPIFVDGFSDLFTTLKLKNYTLVNSQLKN